MQLFCKKRLIVSVLSSSIHRVKQNASLIAAMVFLVVIAYNEFVCYHLSHFSWQPLNARQKKSRFMKILVVADPQLQGYYDEPPLLGYLTRFDADRYLQKTFQVASDFFKPDLVIFLGDLLDEGSRAKRNDFRKTVQRFFDIFQMPPDVLRMYVPGDNDVGGEANDVFTSERLALFQQSFSHKSHFTNIVFYYVNFIEANVMSGRYHALNQVTTKNSKQSVDIVVSHMTLLDSLINVNARDILSNTQPNLILSAHDHKAKLMKSRTPMPSGESYSSTIKPGDNPIYLLLSGQMTFEIVSPTCSYRMGVPEMGYGAVLVEQLEDGSVVVQYTVFWNPKRYPKLYGYLVLLLISALLGIVKISNLICSFNSTEYRRNKS